LIYKFIFQKKKKNQKQKQNKNKKKNKKKKKNCIGSSYNWSSPFILGLFATFLVMLFCFIIIEYKIAREPIIPFPLFRKKNILLCIIISFFSGYIFITFNNTFSMLYRKSNKYY